MTSRVPRAPWVGGAFWHRKIVVPSDVLPASAARFASQPEPASAAKLSHQNQDLRPTLYTRSLNALNGNCYSLTVRHHFLCLVPISIVSICRALSVRIRCNHRDRSPTTHPHASSFVPTSSTVIASVHSNGPTSNGLSVRWQSVSDEYASRPAHHHHAEHGQLHEPHFRHVCEPVAEPQKRHRGLQTEAYHHYRCEARVSCQCFGNLCG